ncbi:hypothetical protein [Paludisphaera mucosa]|uniref:Uncharacterized protein n=1 Tax=Paludisphaera mucosa TaxID=3030827 RepID=A0ABT6F719_9BACT|nr:hypothetical protein [Paludisphaera mucosa]MDG3003354.1 hypothetical protein [Paludisphaera mucosa]
MTRGHRPRILVARVLGIILLIPGLLQVPLPQADFHIVRHRHGMGEVCAQHDHLLRWHPQAGDGEAVAVLHWHWLLPKYLDPSALDADGRALPALHAHDGETASPDRAAAPMIVGEDRGRDVGRCDLDSGIASLSADLAWIGHDPPHPSASSSRRGGPADGRPCVTALSRLVRWNC